MMEKSPIRSDPYFPEWKPAFSRWAEPTDYRFRLRVFFSDTNLQIAVIIPKLLLGARHTRGTTMASKHLWPKYIRN